MMISAASQTAVADLKPGSSRDQWLVLTAAFLGWMFDGVE